MKNVIIAFVAFGVIQIASIFVIREIIKYEVKQIITPLVQKTDTFKDGIKNIFKKEKND